MAAPASWMRRRLVVLGTIAFVVVAAAVVVVVSAGPSTGAARAAELVDDSGNFATGLAAGETLARVSALLVDEADGCDAAERTCEALHSSAAFAHVLAARVLLCTAPGRVEAQTKMRAVLDAVEAGQPPSLPTLPACG